MMTGAIRLTIHRDRSAGQGDAYRPAAMALPLREIAVEIEDGDTPGGRWLWRYRCRHGRNGRRQRAGERGYDPQLAIHCGTKSKTLYFLSI